MSRLSRSFQWPDKLEFPEDFKPLGTKVDGGHFHPFTEWRVEFRKVIFATCPVMTTLLMESPALHIIGQDRGGAHYFQSMLRRLVEFQQIRKTGEERTILSKIGEEAIKLERQLHEHQGIGGRRQITQGSALDQESRASAYRSPPHISGGTRSGASLRSGVDSAGLQAVATRVRSRSPPASANAGVVRDFYGNLIPSMVTPQPLGNHTLSPLTTNEGHQHHSVRMFKQNVQSADDASESRPPQQSVGPAEATPLPSLPHNTRRVFTPTVRGKRSSTTSTSRQPPRTPIDKVHAMLDQTRQHLQALRTSPAAHTNLQALARAAGAQDLYTQGVPAEQKGQHQVAKMEPLQEEPDQHSQKVVTTTQHQSDEHTVQGQENYSFSATQDDLDTLLQTPTPPYARQNNSEPVQNFVHYNRPTPASQRNHTQRHSIVGEGQPSHAPQPSASSLDSRADNQALHFRSAVPDLRRGNPGDPGPGPSHPASAGSDPAVIAGLLQTIQDLQSRLKEVEYKQHTRNQDWSSPTRASERHASTQSGQARQEPTDFQLGVGGLYHWPLFKIRDRFPTVFEQLLVATRKILDQALTSEMRLKYSSYKCPTEAFCAIYIESLQTELRDMKARAGKFRSYNYKCRTAIAKHLSDQSDFKRQLAQSEEVFAQTFLTEPDYIHHLVRQFNQPCFKEWYSFLMELYKKPSNRSDPMLPHPREQDIFQAYTDYRIWCFNTRKPEETGVPKKQQPQRQKGNKTNQEAKANALQSNEKAGGKGWNRKCFGCNKPGHLIANCPTKDTNKSSRPQLTKEQGGCYYNGHDGYHKQKDCRLYARHAKNGTLKDADNNSNNSSNDNKNNGKEGRKGKGSGKTGARNANKQKGNASNGEQNGAASRSLCGVWVDSQSQDARDSHESTILSPAAQATLSTLTASLHQIEGVSIEELADHPALNFEKVLHLGFSAEVQQHEATHTLRTIKPATQEEMGSGGCDLDLTVPGHRLGPTFSSPATPAALEVAAHNTQIQEELQATSQVVPGQQQSPPTQEELQAQTQVWKPGWELLCLNHGITTDGQVMFPQSGDNLTRNEKALGIGPDELAMRVVMEEQGVIPLLSDSGATSLATRVKPYNCRPCYPPITMTTADGGQVKVAGIGTLTGWLVDIFGQPVRISLPHALWVPQLKYTLLSTVALVKSGGADVFQLRARTLGAARPETIFHMFGHFFRAPEIGGSSYLFLRLTKPSGSLKSVRELLLVGAQQYPRLAELGRNYDLREKTAPDIAHRVVKGITTAASKFKPPKRTDRDDSTVLTLSTTNSGDPLDDINLQWIADGALPGVRILSRLAELSLLPTKIYDTPPQHHNLMSLCSRHQVQNGKVCPLEEKKIGDILTVTATEMKAVWELAHRRLGHLGKDDLRRHIRAKSDAFKRANFSRLEKMVLADFMPDINCKDCQKATYRKRSGKLAKCRAKRPGDMFSWDRSGTLPTSVRKYTSFLLAVDHYSDKVFYFKLKSTSADAIEREVAFLHEVCKKTLGHGVSIIRSDSTSEFLNQIVLGYCKNNHIRTEASVPHHQSQNGKVEVYIGLVKRRGLTNLIQAGHSYGYWCYANSHACRTQNATAVRYGVLQPDGSYLRSKRGDPHAVIVSPDQLFGTPVYIKLHPYGCLVIYPSNDESQDPCLPGVFLDYDQEFENTSKGGVWLKPVGSYVGVKVIRRLERECHFYDDDFPDSWDRDKAAINKSRIEAFEKKWKDSVGIPDDDQYPTPTPIAEPPEIPVDPTTKSAETTDPTSQARFKRVTRSDTAKTSGKTRSHPNTPAVSPEEEEKKQAPSRARKQKKKKKQVRSKLPKQEQHHRIPRWNRKLRFSNEKPTSIRDYDVGDFLVAYDSEDKFKLWVCKVLKVEQNHLHTRIFGTYDRKASLKSQEWAMAWHSTADNKKIYSNRADPPETWEPWTWNVVFSELRSGPFNKLVNGRIPAEVEVWADAPTQTQYVDNLATVLKVWHGYRGFQHDIPGWLPRRKKTKATSHQNKQISKSLEEYDRLVKISKGIARLTGATDVLTDTAFDTLDNLKIGQPEAVAAKDVLELLQPFAAFSRRASNAMIEFNRRASQWRKSALKSHPAVLKEVTGLLLPLNKLIQQYDKTTPTFRDSADAIDSIIQDMAKYHNVKLKSGASTEQVRSLLTGLGKIKLSQVAVPGTLKAALEDRVYGRFWRKACDLEIESLINNKTWVEIDHIPKGARVISVKWVFKPKDEDGHGFVTRFKARLVVRGFLQRQGVDYDETYAPTLSYHLLKLTLLWAQIHKLGVFQFDVETAFLVPELPEGRDIYVSLPAGSISGQDKPMVVKLLKALYGLKQAPRLWNKKFVSSLRKLGFEEVPGAPCLYIRERPGEPPALLALFVDDSILAATPEIKALILRELSKEYTIKDLGRPKQILGFGVEWSADGSRLFLHQEQYVSRVIDRFVPKEIQETWTAGADSPAEEGWVPQEDEFGSEEDLQTLRDKNFPEGIADFRAILGSLLHATHTRPDISTVVNMLARFAVRPGTGALKRVRRVLRYLHRTRDYGQLFRPDDLGVQFYADADFAGDVITRRSRSGGAVTLWGSLILYYSRLQSCVALSTTEAEINALTIMGREAIALKATLVRLGLMTTDTPFRVHEDNTGAVFTCNSPQLNRRNKHYQTKWQWLAELVAGREMETVTTPTKDMLADGFTKNFGVSKLRSWRSQVGIVPRSQL